MSARAGAGPALQAAIVAALSQSLTTAQAGFAVFDAQPVRGGVPHAIVEEPVLADWSTKDWRGREGRVAVTLVDGGERPVRLRGAIGLVEDALEALATGPAAGMLESGWRLVTVALARSRLVKAGSDRWRATIEFQVRMMQA